MTNAKTTRKALLTSVMALVICVTMLMGTTFAWFTDTATVAVNKIVSGNLDIGLEYSTDLNDWADAETAAENAVFGTDDLWEPGFTKVVYFKITNNGNLAVKYKIGTNIVANTTGLTKDGEVIDLTKYIQYGIVNTDTAYTAAALARDAITAPTAFNAISVDGDVILKEGETKTFAMVAWMPEVTGNEANHDGTNVPSVKFGIAVYATQASFEKDSFDEKYDEKAPLPEVTPDEVTEALENAKPGDTVNLGSVTIDVDSIPEGVTLAGNGAENTSINVPANDTGSRTTGLIIDKPGVTITDATLVKNDAITSDQYAGVVAVKAGDTTFDGLEIHTNSNAAAFVIDSFKTGTVAISNSTLSSKFKTIHIADGANGKVVINNCDISGVYPFNVNSASSPDLVVEVTDSKLHGWTSYNAKLVTFTDTEFTMGSSGYNIVAAYSDTVFTNCTFGSDFEAYAQVNGFTWTFNNCTKDGVEITAENIKTMFEDTAVWEGCTCIVNGVTVE